MTAVSQSALLPGSPALPLARALGAQGSSGGEFQRLLLSQLDHTPGAAAAEQDKNKAVARELESELLKILFKSMWETVPKDDMLANGTGSDFYREMWIDALSEKIARSGSGLGLAEVIEREIGGTYHKLKSPELR